MLVTKNSHLHFLGVLALLFSSNTFAGHFYGDTPGDPAVDAISGQLATGTLSGLLPASAPQPNEGSVHIVVFANAGDNITVDTIGSDADPGLALNTDVAQDGIFVGDLPNGVDLTLIDSDDDSAGGLNSEISFVAPYTGQYLLSISEIDGDAMNWVMNVSGSTGVVSASGASATAVPTMSAYGVVLTMLGLLLVATRRLRVSAKRD